MSITRIIPRHEACSAIVAAAPSAPITHPWLVAVDRGPAPQEA